jgi:hypothetical protein
MSVVKPADAECTMGAVGRIGKSVIFENMKEVSEQVQEGFMQDIGDDCPQLTLKKGPSRSKL